MSEEEEETCCNWCGLPSDYSQEGMIFCDLFCAERFFAEWGENEA